MHEVQKTKYRVAFKLLFNVDGKLCTALLTDTTF